MKKTQELSNRNAVCLKQTAVILTRTNGSSKEQEIICRNFAEENGIEVVRYMRLETKGLKADEYVALTESIAADKRVNTVLVYSYDRLSRIGTELSALVDYLNTKGISVISATQPFVPKYK